MTNTLNDDMNPQTNKLIIGNIECCDLPELGITALEARVDTGAKTSSLHVDNLEKFDKNGVPWLRFDIHPDIYHIETVVTCEAKLHDVRRIKSSNGVSQQRYTIQTDFALGGEAWPIEITLSDRAEMSYLMLLGRGGMGDRVLVDPSKSFLVKST